MDAAEFRPAPTPFQASTPPIPLELTKCRLIPYEPAQSGGVGRPVCFQI
jgi:hypothetical protein